MAQSRSSVLFLVAACILAGALAGFLARPLLFAPESPSSPAAETIELRAALERAEATARDAADAAARAEQAASRSERIAKEAKSAAAAAEASPAPATDHAVLERLDRLEQTALRRGEVEPLERTPAYANLMQRQEQLEKTVRENAPPELRKAVAGLVAAAQRTGWSVSGTNPSIPSDEPLADCDAEGMFVVDGSLLVPDQQKELAKKWPGATAALVRVDGRGERRLIGGVSPTLVETCGDAAFVRPDAGRGAVAVAWIYRGELWYRSLDSRSPAIRVGSGRAHNPTAAIVGGELWVFYQTDAEIRFARADSWVGTPAFVLGTVAPADPRSGELKIHREGDRFWLTWKVDERTLRLAMFDERTGAWPALDVVIVSGDLPEAEEQAAVWARQER